MSVESAKTCVQAATNPPKPLPRHALASRAHPVGVCECNERAEAADYRLGVTIEIAEAERIANERGLPFEVVLPSEHQEMW